MNSDIADLATWVTHWLIPEHPQLALHAPYLERVRRKQLVHCKIRDDKHTYLKFLDEVDGILYVEHPCLRDEFDIVVEAKKLGKFVVGIPMWEWWPERKPWSLKTDLLWAVTTFTHRYLTSLSDVLYAHGWKHDWRHRVYGHCWGVNLPEFPFAQRQFANSFVFINGNGGYKLRKASDLVFEAFSRPDSPPLLIYTQQSHNIARNIPANVTLVQENFLHRKDVYTVGDVFLFPSYWEGLCHGLYEAQASGGLVVTTDHAPMNECGTDLLIPVAELSQEDLSGKRVVKAVADAAFLHELCKSIYKQPIQPLSVHSREHIEQHFNLANTLGQLLQVIKASI